MAVTNFMELCVFVWFVDHSQQCPRAIPCLRGSVLGLPLAVLGEHTMLDQKQGSNGKACAPVLWALLHQCVFLNHINKAMKSVAFLLPNLFILFFNFGFLAHTQLRAQQWPVSIRDGTWASCMQSLFKLSPSNQLPDPRTGSPRKEIPRKYLTSDCSSHVT